MCCSENNLFKFYSILADISSKMRVVVHGAALTKTPNAFTFYTHNSSLSASHDLQPPSILIQSEYSLIFPHILSTLLATQNILAHLLRGNFCFTDDTPTCQLAWDHFF